MLSSAHELLYRRADASSPRKGAPGLLTREAWDVLTGAASAVYVRTMEARACRPQLAGRAMWADMPSLQHPTLKCLPASVKLRSFDDVYESSDTLQGVYPQARPAHVLRSPSVTCASSHAAAAPQITERLLSAARAGEPVVYAVPGDPCIAEMTVRLLRDGAAAAGVPVRTPRCCSYASVIAPNSFYYATQLRVLSAVSFLEPLLEALGIDVLPSLWVGDALDVAAAGHPPFSVATPALLTQLYSRGVASEVKLTLMAALPDEHRVALVHCAGDAEGGKPLKSTVEWMPLHAIDRSEAIAARTTLYVPPWAEAEAPASFEAVLAGVARAHEALDGPWREGDPEHADVAAQLLAAAKAAVAASAKQDAPALQGAFFDAPPFVIALTVMMPPFSAALADVLLAVATHAQVASDEGDFSARHVIAAAAARAAALSGGDDEPGGAPQAPQGRGYTLDEGSDDDE